MYYRFVFVFAVLLPCFFHSRSSGRKVEFGIQYVDPGITPFELEPDEMRTLKSLFGSYEFVSVLEPEVVDEILKYGFMSSNTTLNLIDERLCELAVRTGTNSLQAYVNESIAKTQMLADALSVYQVNVHDNVKRNQFLRACWNHSMLVITQLIYQEILIENFERSLVDSGVTMADFLVSSDIIIFTYIKAAILGHTCLGKFYENESILQDFSAIYRKTIRQDLREIVKNLKMKYLFNYHVYYFPEPSIDDIQEVKNYVANYALDNQDQSHQEFVNEVYEYLAKTYNWRLWLVVSFKEPNARQNVHSITVNSNYSFYIDKGYNRGIFVSSPETAWADDFSRSIDACFEQSLRTTPCAKFWRQHPECLCKDQIHEFLECNGSIDFKGIVCLWRGLDVKFKGSSTGYIVYSELMHQYGSRVPVEKTHKANFQHDFIVVL